MEASEARGKVLIVDDDLDVLASNARFLRVSSYEVIVCNTARTALDHVANDQLDVVVTDLRMPDIDGLELARRTRTIKPLLPILFFSAYASIPDVVSAMNLGAVDFLEKPVDPDKLLERLDDICGDHRDTQVNIKMAFDDTSVPFRQRVLAYEKYLIEFSLAKYEGRISSVLEELNINRRTLNEKMSRLLIKRK